METYRDIIHCKRPRTRRYHMSNAHRAKQFAPFAALKGYDESIQKQELIFVPYQELSDEQKNELDHKLRHLTCGAMITASYFVPSSVSSDLGNYHTISGIVEFLDTKNRRIQIGNTVISFPFLTSLEGDCFSSFEEPS